jgi:DNA-binding MarR family transcriptional regulator
LQTFWFNLSKNAPAAPTKLDRMARMSCPEKTFTPKQGQYLAFIYAYSRLHRRPPAESDMQRHFRVSPPSVHQMVMTLERAGFIRRQPGVARSIELLIAPEYLPVLL